MNNDIRTEEQETVSGIVDSIIYQNEDNGYVVFEMEDTSGYPVTVTGIIPVPHRRGQADSHGKMGQPQDLRKAV